MNRRQFLTRAGGGALGVAALPGMLAACGGDVETTSGLSSSTSAGPSTTRALTQVKGDKPWWLQGNFAPVSKEVRSTSLKVTGSIPDELAGLYVRNGSNSVNADTGHWFIGDGMLHGVRLEGGEAKSYANRWVRTTLYESGDGFADAGIPGGDIGYSNVSAFTHNNKLFTSGEIGFPYELSPKDLSTVGVYDFDGKLDTNMTAHPKVDPETGELHFFGYGFFEPFLTYHVADAQGRLIHSAPIEVGKSTMMHDFAITDRDVVFWEFPVVLDLSMAAKGADLPFRWEPEYGARIGVMPLGGTNADIRWVEVPPAYVFHGINAFRDGDDVVVDVSQFETMFENGPLGQAPELHRWRINTAGKELTFSDDTLEADLHMDLPSRDPRRVGRKYRYGYLIEAVNNPDTVQLGGLYKQDFETNTQEYFNPGADRVCDEGLFVPTGDAEDDGYVFTYSYNAERDGSDLLILAAQDFAAEPVATIELPQRVPHGFHATWVAADDA